MTLKQQLNSEKQLKNRWRAKPLISFWFQRTVLFSYHAQCLKEFFSLQEAQLFRIIMPGEEELGSTQPQTMCFITRFSHSDFISSDAMSKLRQVCICFSSPTPIPASTPSAFFLFIIKHRAFYMILMLKAVLNLGSFS